MLEPLDDSSELEAHRRILDRELVVRR
jgi:hypothetical protein